MFFIYTIYPSLTLSLPSGCQKSRFQPLNPFFGFHDSDAKWALVLLKMLFFAKDFP